MLNLFQIDLVVIYVDVNNRLLYLFYLIPVLFLEILKIKSIEIKSIEIKSIEIKLKYIKIKNYVNIKKKWVF